MSNNWYSEGHTSVTTIGCSFQNAPPVTVCSTYDQTTMGEMTKNQDIIPSPIVNSNVFQNCFYAQAPEYSSGYQRSQEIGVKSECYDDNGNLDPYNYSEFSKYENCVRWPQNQNVVSPYTSRFWPRMSRNNHRQIRDSPIKVTLDNKGLMERFNKHCTEMIITKTGRRMFPSPQISLQGLEPSTKYFVLFDIVPADDNRYKFHHFNWVVAGKSEPLPPSRLYIHPESPLTGNQWSKHQIAFHKVKLTNNTCDQHGHMILNSMHRYQPRIHIVSACDVYAIQFQPFHTFTFQECQFIAVTAYQNSQITQLKIEHNPFAKGFRKPEKEKREKRKISMSKDEPTTPTEKSEDGAQDGVLPCADANKEVEVEDKTEQKREIGYYDLNQNRWNYPNVPGMQCFSQQRHEAPQPYPYLRRSPLSNSYFQEPQRSSRFDSMSSDFSGSDKFPYENFDQPKYPSADTEFCTYDQARQFPYPTDLIMAPYKANVPSFI